VRHHRAVIVRQPGGSLGASAGKVVLRVGGEEVVQ
jgi:hypothetical protein